MTAVVTTTIASVTVHRNGALVVRRGTAPAGDVEVRGLPLLFAAETLRIRPAQGAVTSLAETVRLESLPAPLPPSEGEREQLLLALAQVDDELRTCDLLLEVLGRSRPEGSEGGELEPKLVDARAWIAVLKASRHKAGELAKQRQALAARRRDLEQQRRRLDERTRALVEPDAPSVLRGVRFTLDVAGPFSLEYFVAAARWVPTYALQLTSSSATGSAAGSRGRLVTAALVAQASGESWDGVALAVSTADLTRETTLPTLSSWRISRAQPAAAKGFRALPSDLPTLFAGYDRGPRRPAPASAVAPAPPTGATSTTTARPHFAPAKAEPAPHEDDSEDDSDLDDAVAPDASRLDSLSRLDDVAGTDGYDSGEAGAFETERSSDARLSLPQSLAFEQAETDAEGESMYRRPAAVMAPGAPPPPPKSRGGLGFASGFGAAAGGGASDKSVSRATPELPLRWRTASMRMAGADEEQRGSLLPLDAIARLAWLLESHDVDGAGRAELRRAVQALQQAQQRMEQAPLPRGTSLLLGTSFQSVMRAPATTDVPGDGTFYRVEVRVDEAPAHIEHHAVPRASNDVWRMCRLDVKGAPLPPGPLAVYEDGAFKVNARLDMPQSAPAITAAPHTSGQAGTHASARTSGAIDVNLGVDPDVRVLSRTVHVRQAEKGLMSQTSRVAHDVDIEVRCTRAEAARVVVHDRLPVPADNVKDISVVVIEEKPPLLRSNRDPAGHEVPGAFEWRVTIMPGDTQKLALKYAIDLPAKAELEGGNRRE